MVVDRDVLAALAGESQDLHVGHLSDPQRSRRSVDLERDWSLNDSHDLADVSAEYRGVSASSAREHGAERRRLLLRGTIIEVQRSPPWRVDHVTRRVHRQRHVQTVEGEAFVVAAVDVPSDQHRAVPGRRRTEEHTRAGRLTVARLEIASCHIPRHVGSSVVVVFEPVLQSCAGPCDADSTSSNVASNVASHGVRLRSTKTDASQPP